jgi:hypothetical protein
MISKHAKERIKERLDEKPKGVFKRFLETKIRKHQMHFVKAGGGKLVLMIIHKNRELHVVIDKKTNEIITVYYNN